MAPYRRFVAGKAMGRVLEIGAGTGANIGFYDWNRVESLDLTEPDPFMLQHAGPKLDALPDGVRNKIRLREAPAEALPFDDAAFDCIVATLVFCSVSDLDASLREARRVLKPAGELRLVEHVAASGVWGRVQRLVQPAYGWLAGGCNLSRPTEAALRAAGFELQVNERLKLAPMIPAFTGVAR
jgi:ubiquinone/menaquinone biosynthesis C-methylase UbiE